ncbi:biotin/lipoyl-binding protein [Pseudomonas poae]
MLRLGVTRDGVVAEIKVSEGETVKQGQLLATLDSEPAQLAVAAALGEQQQVEVQARQLTRQLTFAEQTATRLSTAAAAGAGDNQSADEARESAARLRDALEKIRATPRPPQES